MPTRRSWRLPLLVGVAATFVLIALAYALYAPPPNAAGAVQGDVRHPATSDVQIDAYDLFLNYTAAPGQHPDYFDSPDCNGCPFNFTPGASWQLTFSLTNSDRNASHEVVAIVLSPLYSVRAESPSLPAVIGANQTATFTLTVGLPTTPGYYILVGTVDAR